MIWTFILSAVVILSPAALAVAISPRLRAVPGTAIPLMLALSYFTFHAISAATFGLPIAGLFRLLIVESTSTLICCFVTLLLGSRIATALGAGISFRALLVAGCLAILSVSTDAWIFNLQGFNFVDRTSRFAAPFAGDHWRNMAIVAGLARGSDAIFFPDSRLVYQILWHHGGAVIVNALPDVPTLFRYSLGLALFTSFLFNFYIFWMAFSIRPALSRWLVGLVVIAVLTGTDADIFNATISYLQYDDFRIAADSSSILHSPFRYFSAKLVGLTAPQHAAFFIFLAIMLNALAQAQYSRQTNQPGSRDAITISATSAIASILFSPILSLLIIPLVYGFTLLTAAYHKQNFARLVAIGAVSIVAAASLHWAILRFAIWEPFLRQNVTGGGSGTYGLAILPLFRGINIDLAYAPVALWIMTGVTGLVLTFILIAGGVTKRSMFADPLVGALCAGAVVWNFLVVDTEIQRHFSMIVAVLGIWVIARHLPNRLLWSPVLPSAALIIAVVCIGLNAILVRAYTRNAAFMPLTSGWPDYMCMNNLIRRQYPKIAIVSRTPVNFELPISVEATTTLVWSQVAAVHQRISASKANLLDRINPRDWKTFRASAEQNGPELLETLQQFGFDGVIWGPLEERDYGPRVRELLVKPNNFLTSCGTVALYRLDWSKFKAPPTAREGDLFYRLAMATRADMLFSGVAGVDVRIAERLVATGEGLSNVALGTTASQSSSSPGSEPQFAVDGLAEQGRSPISISMNEFSPWWEVDLGEARRIEAIRITTLEDPKFSQYELRDFYILVSDHPFHSANLFEAGIEPEVTSYFVSGQVKGEALWRIARTGRYVRIQRTEQGHLLLYEVEALGR